MKKALIAIIFFIYNFALSQECQIPILLENEIIKLTTNDKVVEDDFYTINNLLFEHEAKGDLKNLIKCDLYSKNINSLFYSDNPEKRVISYRLIGTAKDSTFNKELITRMNSKESSLLKTWSVVALMENKCSRASDDLFRLFSSQENLPLDILINMYAKYDTTAVKATCWKFLHSEIKNQQILAVQCLASYEKDKNLQLKLLEFLDLWENKFKGWIIASMSMQKMENLKPVLEKYILIDDLSEVIIRALEMSPTATDNKFANQLKKNKN